MKKYFRKYLKNEMGMSLAEVLASVVILSILLFFFLGMFVQSSKVNVKSEEVIDATYVAQTHIENLYSLSKQTEFSDRITGIESIDYDEVSPLDPADPWHLFEHFDTSEYKIKFKIQNTTIDNDMTRSIVEVYNVKPDGQEVLEAQMESILQWKEDSTP